MLYTIAVLANVLFFLTFGSLYYRRKIEAIQDPKKRAEYTLPLVDRARHRVLLVVVRIGREGQRRSRAHR